MNTPRDSVEAAARERVARRTAKLFGDPVADAEADKYRRMWSVAEYADDSPRLRHAPDALEWFKATGCHTLMDYGCGDAQAMRWLQEEHDVRCWGVDIASPLNAPGWITTACLWSLPPDFRTTDFAYCTDVLEHLPPNKVPTAIAAIRDHTAKAGLITVHTGPDESGALIGETLHLTVAPAAWWETAIGLHFDISARDVSGNRAMFWCST